MSYLRFLRFFGWSVCLVICSGVSAEEKQEPEKTEERTELKEKKEPKADEAKKVEEKQKEPGKELSKKKEEEKDKKEEEEKEKKEEVAEKKEPSEVSKFLADRLGLSLALGLANAKKETRNWGAFGHVEVSLDFDTGLRILEHRILALVRYTPLDVSPSLRRNKKNEEYSGSTEFYLVGGALGVNVYPDVEALASIELGYAFSRLHDQIGFKESLTVDKNGFMVFFGGGADYQLRPKILVGPRLRVGFGAFTAWQVLANIKFLF